jgi:O-acetyl-ADP-ribose deacetylase (regulator of RNase III)
MLRDDHCSVPGDVSTCLCLSGLNLECAEAYYGEIPDAIYKKAVEMLPSEFIHVLKVFEQGSFYGEKTTRTTEDSGLTSRKYTPENITSLAQSEVFVFGSNLQGSHGGGAAAAAVRYFGAIWGQGVGMQGQCYAIPTMHGGVDVIRPYVDEFIEFAKGHPELTFLVTRIGCGIAGFRDEQMAPLFADALELPNVVLPKSFVKVIK